MIAATLKSSRISINSLYTKPNPFAFSIAVVSLSRNLSFVWYSGNNSLPKHVKAVGSLSVSGPFRCITKTREFNPFNGTLSLAVTNSKSLLLCGISIPCKISQNHLKLAEPLLYHSMRSRVTIIIACTFLQLQEVRIVHSCSTK
jgi:hypothetical protein